MTLKDELLLLRSAARSFTQTENTAHCLDLIRRGNPHQNFFFSELSDPAWIPLLVEAGFFAQLPGPITITDGSIRYVGHPPLFALAKLAKVAPVDVVQVIESLELNENPIVVDQIMRGIAAIDEASLTDRLIGILQKLIEVPADSDWLWLDDVLQKWLRWEKFDACVAVLRTWLMATLRTESSPDARREQWHISHIDREVIGSLGEKRPFEVAELMVEVLSGWARQERQRLNRDKSTAGEDYDQHPDPDNDYPPTYWLEQFGVPSIVDEGVERIAAHRLYSIAQFIFRSNQLDSIQRLDDLLRTDPWFLFRRLRWQLYADFPAGTLAFARPEVLERIPRLGEGVRHPSEFARMLEAHATEHGAAFLGADDVERFGAAVLSGPTQRDENINDDYVRRFQRIQLYPIASLLTERLQEKFAELSANRPPLSSDVFKPVLHGGEARTIEHVAPAKADEMSSMSPSQLWDFLNNWTAHAGQPDSEKWWVEEDVGALGQKFAELVEANPAMFPPETGWWRNLRRPEILYTVLERASTQFAQRGVNHRAQARPPRDAQWQNWLGIASWIAEQQTNSGAPGDDKQSDWTWARMVVIKFLRNMLTGTAQPPRELLPTVGEILKRLVGELDPRLDAKEAPWMSDWLTTAINSVRGTAIEALFELGLYQKKTAELGSPATWIFDVFADRLERSNESPAVFAIIGAHLRLALHLFPSQFRRHADLLLPRDRRPHTDAFITAHVLYDRPASEVIKILPQLPRVALERLQRERASGEKAPQSAINFGSRLGTHLAFYYWNDLLGDDITANSVIDRFFEIASPPTRATTVGQIGSIFETPQLPEKNKALYARVMLLWDRRFTAIERAIDFGLRAPEFDPELTEFIDWIVCEAFPFNWRFDRVMKAITRLERAPRAFSLIEKLEKLTSTGKRVRPVVRLLHALASKGWEELRWSFRDKHVKPILERGFSAGGQTRALTLELQELLLRRGFFEYLEVGAPQTAGESGR
jgi:hypothetical protein